MTMISEKQKECQDLVDEINSTFEVKIDSKDKSASLIWFRYYIIDKYRNELIKVSCEPLNKNYTSVSVARKDLATKSFQQQFKDISKVVETMDVGLYKKFVKTYVRKRYDRVYDSGKEIIKIEGKPKKVIIPTAQAMILLRKNPKSPLWNKEIYRWSFSDWNELKSY